MNAHFDWLVDGSIVGLYLLATMFAGLWVRRYVTNVEGFLVAGREMDAYLGMASLAATEFGIITCMYTAQAGYKYGFAGATPGIIQAVAMFAIGVSGFCIKPLRDSGVMTIPELFERRFGPRVRQVAGIVIVLGGLLNMGVFLRVGGEFLVLATGLDPHALEITMTVLLLLVAIYTVFGGMLSVLVTDLLQFIVMSTGLVVVTALILNKVGWAHMVSAVEEKHGAGGFNPFLNKDLGLTYIAFQVCVQVAATLTWQTVVARVLASKDTRTARRVFTGTSFFFACRFVIPGLWGIAALAMLPADALSSLPGSMAQDPSLHAMPVFLSTIVPVGLMGLLIASMLAADMSTDSSYMLSWASVIYNDILAPFRKQPVSDKQGLLVNRSIVAVIGVFLLFYGLWYPLGSDLWAYCTITGTIYLSSMSVLLIACCYWKGANSWGAFTAIFLGAVFPIAFLILDKLPGTKDFAATIGASASGLLAFAAAAIGMLVGSMCKPRSAA